MASLLTVVGRNHGRILHDDKTTVPADRIEINRALHLQYRLQALLADVLSQHRLEGIEAVVSDSLATVFALQLDVAIDASASDSNLQQLLLRTGEKAGDAISHHHAGGVVRGRTGHPFGPFGDAHHHRLRLYFFVHRLHRKFSLLSAEPPFARSS